jgi:NAD-dependent deacetylase
VRAVVAPAQRMPGPCHHCLGVGDNDDKTTTTDMSDTGGTGHNDSNAAEVARARALLARARRVVVLTGAGISTDSGIPDFRGPQGVWTKNPEAEKMATLQAYVSDSELRRRSWQNRLTSPMWDSEPNAGHAALVALERSGRLDTLVTQNIDGLHQKAGTDPGRMVEIHGTALEVMCLRCSDRQPAEPVHERVRGGEADPSCAAMGRDGEACGGILKSATISFGQSLVAEDLFRAEQAAAACDLLLAVGSTLAVFPAAGLVPVAVQHGGVLVIVNGGPTDMDSLADVVVQGSISEMLPQIVEGLAAVS